MGKDLQPEVAHLVDGAVAGVDADGWGVGVTGVGGGVVVGVVHVEDGVSGEEDGDGEAVDGLAVDVPVVDEDETLLFAVGEEGVGLHGFAEVVGVEVDAEEVNVYGELELVVDEEGWVAGGNVECGVVFKLEEHGVLGSGGVAEVEADGGLDGLGLAGGLEVHVEDEVVAGVETLGHGGGFDEGGGVGLPEEEVGVGVEGGAGVDGDVHAFDAQLPVGGEETAEGGGSVDDDVGVVDDAGRAGLDLHGSDVAGAVDGDREDEVAEEVGAGGGDLHGGVDGEDEVRRADLPVGGVDGRGGSFGGVAFGHPGGGPLADQVNVVFGEATGIGEVSEAGFGEPGRHVAAGGDLLHEGSPALGVGVGEEREGPGAAGVMACGAVLVDDGGDVTSVGDGGFFGLDGAGVAGGCDEAGCRGCGDEDCGGAEVHWGLMMLHPMAGPEGGWMGRWVRVAVIASSRSCLVARGRAVSMVM